MEKKPPTELQIITKRLFNARKNYRASIRWYKEVLGYRATVVGDEWKQKGEESWLAEDAEFEYDEVVKDIKRYRELINILKKRWDELQENDNGQ